MSVPDFIHSIPELPGVYLFKDKDLGVIYIGKAKRLRARVRSYFQNRYQDWKVESLMAEYHALDYILTGTELEALLLEAQLIKEYKPKFNVLLKHGNPFTYILFTMGAMPEVKLVRTKREKGIYFGPFIHKKQARIAYAYLMRTFRLQLCTKRMDNGCLDYHLGMCAGSCLQSFEPEEYIQRVQLAREALEGNFESIERALKADIVRYNSERSYEKARNVVNYLHSLPTIFATLQAHIADAKRYKEGTDVFSAQGATLCSQEMYERGLEELKSLLGLSAVPRTIDCFDISHFQGRDMVASCVRFNQKGPDKHSCRRFKIRTLSGQNDYAALQEAVVRRYKKGDMPDVVLIDGGKGQLSSVMSVMPQACIVSLAKREERLFTYKHEESFVLDNKTALGQLLIALRDYAHHFAISYHKLLRIKSITSAL